MRRPCRSRRRSNKARRPDLLDEIINACQYEAKRSFVDEAPVSTLLMPAADHVLRPEDTACRTRRDRRVGSSGMRLQMAGTRPEEHHDDAGQAQVNSILSSGL